VSYEADYVKDMDGNGEDPDSAWNDYKSGYTDIGGNVLETDWVEP
jgi:hypothetical protein